MSTATTFRTLRRNKGQRRIRFSGPGLIVLVALVGVFVPHSRSSSATSSSRISNDSKSRSEVASGSEARRSRAHEAAGSSDSPVLSVDTSASSSLGLLRDYLLGVRGSSLQQQAPVAGVVETFATNPGPVCNLSMPKTDFNLGESVCARITDAAFATRKFSWVSSPNVSRQNGPNMTMNPDTNIFTLPSTRTTDIGPGDRVENRGTWKAEDRSTSNTLQGQAQFLVHDPAHPMADLQVVAGSGSQMTNQITYPITIYNAGPDAGQNAKIQATIPNNTTFASMTPPNGSWTCPAPVGGTVICTRTGGPLPFNSSESTNLVVSIDAGTVNQSQLTTKITVSSDLEDAYPRTNVAVVPFLATNATTGPAIGAAGSAPVLVSDSCTVTPPQVIDPGEVVTLTLCAQNNGNSATGASLLGTLQAIGGVKNPSAAQTYGSIAGGGGSACQNFTFTVANLPCGSQITPTVVFTEGATPRGTAVFGSPQILTGKLGSNNGVSICCNTPTASESTIVGQITTDDGFPLAGVMMNLSGNESRRTITDANGRYRFDNVETNNFYIVTPSRANYEFSPTARSFSQIGESTEAVFTATATEGTQNPLDTAEYFVRQHYLDFLGREPDEAGFNFWSDQILGCGSDSGCIERRTINVSAAYFLSIEFQQTGGLVDGLYHASYGRAPRYAEFMPDARVVANDLIVGRGDWAQELESNKQAFVNAWVERPAFRAAYDRLANATFVDTLISNAGAGFNGDRDALVGGLNNGSLTRTAVLRQVVENEGFTRAKSNEMFVMMEYFGYLRRDPDDSGYHFWLNKLNEFGGNFEQAEMVKAFIISSEYRARFQR